MAWTGGNATVVVEVGDNVAYCAARSYNPWPNNMDCGFELFTQYHVDIKGLGAGPVYTISGSVFSEGVDHVFRGAAGDTVADFTTPYVAAPTTGSETPMTPAELGINPADMAAVFGWGFFLVISFWALGYAIGAAVKVIKAV